MSIFSKIKNAIFGHEARAATVDNVGATSGTQATSQVTEPAVTKASAGAATGASVPPTAGATAASPAPAAPSSAPVDVAPILDAAVKKSGQKLDWKHSIVDLMKALGMDASLSERKELADELGYTGDTNDSAKMNMWLHRELMRKLSENGGKVPADLLD